MKDTAYVISGHLRMVQKIWQKYADYFENHKEPIKYYRYYQKLFKLYTNQIPAVLIHIFCKLRIGELWMETDEYDVKYTFKLLNDSRFAAAFDVLYNDSDKQPEVDILIEKLNSYKFECAALLVGFKAD